MTEAIVAPFVSRPLYRDPVFDGAADPVVVWNRVERLWWMIYTSRRANAPALPGVTWIHGTDLGVASSVDGGATWFYRGVVQGLDTEWGRHTYWAPVIVDEWRGQRVLRSADMDTWRPQGLILDAGPDAGLMRTPRGARRSRCPRGGRRRATRLRP